MTDKDHSYLHGTTDQDQWAKAFNETAQSLGYSAMDEGWLAGWFANAMMAKHDAMLAARQTQPPKQG